MTTFQRSGIASLLAQLMYDAAGDNEIGEALALPGDYGTQLIPDKLTYEKLMVTLLKPALQEALAGFDAELTASGFLDKKREPEALDVFNKGDVGKFGPYGEALQEFIQTMNSRDDRFNGMPKIDSIMLDKFWEQGLSSNPYLNFSEPLDEMRDMIHGSVGVKAVTNNAARSSSSTGVASLLFLAARAVGLAFIVAPEINEEYESDWTVVMLTFTTLQDDLRWAR